MNRPLLSVSTRVSEAIAAGRGVVALETTLVTHGLPSPEGLEVAIALGAAVAESEAEPATIGNIDGQVRVGLDQAELGRLATCGSAVKLNLSNLAAHLASGSFGSTTVAAMLVAHQLGITVFATGGIGGVHRDAAETGDVSPDLTALARFPVAVVSAGAKAVLNCLAPLNWVSCGLGRQRKSGQLFDRSNDRTRGGQRNRRVVVRNFNRF